MRHSSGVIKFVVVFVMVFGLFCQIQTARAGDDAPQNAKLEIEKLTLFKNGFGFIVSNATLPENAQSVRIGQLPVPAFGTFWVGYPKDVKLQSLITSMEDQEKKVPVQSIGELLRLNAGRKVILYTSGRDVECTVLAETTPKEPPETQNPYFMGTRRLQDSYGRNISEIPPSKILIIKTAQGIIAMEASSIYRAEFIDGEPVNTTYITQKRPSIRMKLEKPAGGEKISVSYLARGVTWSPSYLIDLSDPKTAKFSAHAVIVNEMTDFKNVKLQLATGFPNIKFGEILNPVAKSQSLAEFLGSLSSTRGRQPGDQYMVTQQALMSNVGLASSFEEEASSLVPGYSTATEGLVAEDLFFYPVKNFTLMKDETAWLPLFTAEMPYKHVYTWKIGDFLDKEDRYRTERETQERKTPEEVWHSCRLVNTLSMPLTTAATEFVTNGEFTGQDVCYYTAPKAETTIRINKALNLLAEQAEIEVERKREAAVFHGYHYDLVKVQGELKIRNKLDKTINVEITKELSGEVLESLPESKDIKTAKGLKQVNPKHILTWGIDLNPGEEQTVTYQYQVYIRE